MRPSTEPTWTFGRTPGAGTQGSRARVNWCRPNLGLELGAQGFAAHVLEGAVLAIARVVDERAEPPSVRASASAAAAATEAGSARSSAMGTKRGRAGRRDRPVHRAVGKTRQPERAAPRRGGADADEQR
jgi:hypothetical protein